MLLTRNEFNTHLSENRLTLALIGMSGMGKTYWSGKLAEIGFTHYCCDDEIAKRISSLLPSADVTSLAAWMGQPYSEGYREREQKYLELEELVTRDGLSFSHPEHTFAGSRHKNKKNLVIDTTGSVIYLSESTLYKLKQNTLIIYLEANQAVKDRLFQVYMSDPKPVAWGESFYKKEDESDHDALVRCYPELLAYRSQAYLQLADVVIPYAVAKDESSGGEEFLNIVRQKLS